MNLTGAALGERDFRFDLGLGHIRCTLGQARGWLCRAARPGETGGEPRPDCEVRFALAESDRDRGPTQMGLDIR